MDLYFAITEALVPANRPRLAEVEHAAVVAQTSAFVRAQIESLPPRLLILMKLGLTGFRVLVRVRYARGFCALPLTTRQRVVARWAWGPVPLTRQLFRSLRSIALLAYYEHPAVLEKMGVPPA